MRWKRVEGERGKIKRSRRGDNQDRDPWLPAKQWRPLCPLGIYISSSCPLHPWVLQWVLVVGLATYHTQATMSTVPYVFFLEQLVKTEKFRFGKIITSYADKILEYKLETCDI